MSFQFCGERADFCFPPPIRSSVLALSSSPEAPTYSVSHGANSGITMFDGDGGPHMRFVAMSDLHSPIPTTLGGTTFCLREVLEATAFITSPSPPPPPSVLSSSASLR